MVREACGSYMDEEGCMGMCKRCCIGGEGVSQGSSQNVGKEKKGPSILYCSFPF